MDCGEFALPCCAARECIFPGFDGIIPDVPSLQPVMMGTDLRGMTAGFPVANRCGVCAGSGKLNGCESASDRSICRIRRQGKVVTQHVERSCPKCGRTLRVRPEFLGHRVVCKSCNHVFRAEVDSPPSAPAAVAPTVSATPTGEVEKLKAT